MVNNKDLLWRRLQDAKLQLDVAHQQITRAKEDKISGTVPSADGNYAHTLTLHDHELAVTNYLKALGDLKAALLANQQVDAQPENIEVSENGITPREREVLALIAAGKSSKEIAAHLGVAFRTVVAHRYHLQTKLKVHKTADLTRLALRMGLIEL